MKPPNGWVVSKGHRDGNALVVTLTITDEAKAALRQRINNAAEQFNEGAITYDEAMALVTAW